MRTLRKQKVLNDAEVAASEARLRREGLDHLPAEPKLTPTQIETVYPEQKTLDDQYRDDLARERRLTARTPARSAAKVAAIVTALGAIWAFYLLNIESLWYAGQAGIFLSFFLALLAVAVSIFGIQAGWNILYRLGKTGWLTAVVGFLGLAVIAATIVAVNGLHIPWGLALLIAALVQFMLTWGLVRFTTIGSS